ncbi:hypothetical protein ACFLT1_07420 [Bacteroidota bacterium]
MKRLLLLFWLGLMFLPVKAQFNEALDVLNEYVEKFPKEILYLHTDREAYTPGDTIWFKAYLRENTSLKKLTISETIFLNVIDKDGNIVSSTKHLVFDSELRSQVILPTDFNPGLYHLIAYSSWMKNFHPSELFRKTLLIKEEVHQEPQYLINLDKQYYLEGEEAKVFIRFLDGNREDVLRRNLRCRTYHGDELIDDLKIESGLQNIFRVELPDRLEEDISLNISSVYIGFGYDTTIHIPVHRNIHLDFFPEGGYCTEGFLNRIAYKAQNEKGDAIDIKGALYNMQGERLLEFQSEYLGMGSFIFLPEEGQEYFVLLTSPTGISRKFYLPEIQKSGWSMNAMQLKDHLHLKLMKSDSEIELGLITLEIRGQLHRYIIDSVHHEYSYSIPADDLPPGIAVITLYDEQLIPQAERLVFINYDKIINPQLHADYIAYLPRDKTKLDIRFDGNSIDYERGAYSLAVVDEDYCMEESIDEGNILTSFLLSSEIKGYIEKPGYYFQDISPVKKNHLDLLLLTQGWRRYSPSLSEKKGLIDGGNFPSVREIIRGQLITDKWARRQVPLKGIITIYNAGGVGKMETDDDGKFEFMHNYEKNISPNLSLFGSDLSGKTNVEIRIEEDHYKDTVSWYLQTNAENIYNQISIMPSLISEVESRFTAGINNRWIEEVVIYAKRNQKEYRVDANLSTATSASKNAIENATDLYSILINMGLPVWLDGTGIDQIIVWQGHEKGIVHWFLDDLPKEYIDIRYLLPEEIDDLIILRFPDTQIWLSSNEGTIGEVSGVVGLVYSKPLAELNMLVSIKNAVMLKRFEDAREFYQPKYDSEMLLHSNVMDLRKTIHWENDLRFNADGRAESEYYNGDRYGKMQCILQGITDEGIPVYGEFEYLISTSREKNEQSQ